MENEFRSDDKSHLPFDPFKVSNSKYSRYEEKVLIKLKMGGQERP